MRDRNTADVVKRIRADVHGHRAKGGIELAYFIGCQHRFVVVSQSGFEFIFSFSESTQTHGVSDGHMTGTVSDGQVYTRW